LYTIKEDNIPMYEDVM